MDRKRWLVLVAVAVAAVLALCAAHFLGENEDASSLQKFGLILEEEQDAVTVLAVMEDSPASRCGMLPGDIIRQVNEEDIRAIAQFEDALHHRERPRPLRIIVLRDEKPCELMLKSRRPNVGGKAD